MKPSHRYAISLDKIWDRELANTRETEEESMSVEQFKEVQENIIRIAQAAGHQPYMNPDSQTSYFIKYKELSARGPLRNVYFLNDALYRLEEDLEIKPNVGQEYFFDAFRIQLKRYLVNSEQKMADFLNFQKKDNFGDSPIRFQYFLEQFLVFHEDSLAPKTIAQLRYYLLLLEDSANALEEGETKQSLSGFEPIVGNMNDQEIEYFFSFLYKEKAGTENGLISKEDFLSIFNFGFAIPPQDFCVRMVKLNRSPKFTKSSFEYLIYQFYRNYETSSKCKKQVLRFFATYFEDFSVALLSNQNLQNWSANVTGEKPPKEIPFDYNKYLPARFH
jgi:hypothetical protein